MALCGFFTITLSHDIKRVGNDYQLPQFSDAGAIESQEVCYRWPGVQSAGNDVPVPPYDTCEELMLPLIKHEPTAFGCFLVVAELHI